MVSVSSSNKFNSKQQQQCISSSAHVLLRIIRRQESYTVMTATAGEDDRSKSAYPEQNRLIKSAVDAFSKFGVSARYEHDLYNRPYVQFSCANVDQILRAGKLLADALGLELTEMAELWRELSDAADEGGVVYLSDGMWLTEDGQLIER